MTPLDALPVCTLDGMYEAAAQAVAVLESMAARGLNPVTAALEGAHAVEEWAHYPDGDARDGRARYYYHAHSADELGAGEHGHFHVFLEPNGNADAAPTHVVGLAMDAAGGLLRLFTTNGWVTGESWRDARTIVASLADFEIKSAPERADLDAWITSIVRLYRPRIERLLQARDATLLDMRARDPNGATLEDRSVRVLSDAPVDFLRDLRAIEQALDRAPQA